ncbi:uromodulin-like [Myxocyprinus asiaticus]|uniref:uromodulin-like n=1 Tax=Myxocyprinus asiaticus TaxID=70543 RepID=UPI0022228E12|nr:uromodulin-like [Myxocyprinus asiaticus]
MKNNLMILGLFVMTAIVTDVSGVVVTHCNACHERSTCVPVLKPGQSASTATSFNCSCSKGFAGNGITCFNITACSGAGSPCCSHGYRWTVEQGCVDIDECTATQSPCVAPLNCENMPGSFACLLPPVNANPTSNPRSVQFSCGNTVCNLGQDCITVNGQLRCADPCQRYTALDEPWRATNFKTDGNVHCDLGVNWQGWYRLFLNSASVQMPERCIASQMSGTHAPLWLKSPHPITSDGVVYSNICGNWTNGCCSFEFPIHIKACPGNYYVYKFIKPPICFLAYSADINTKVCSTCRDGTSCVSEDKINWRCEAQDPVRLSAGPHVCAGRVELNHSGRWGTVCDDDWNMNAAAVVCRQLGCGRPLSAPVNGQFGPGSGPIWMDNTNCLGSERHLSQCKHNGYEKHNCGHYEDAGVVCEEPSPPPMLVLVCEQTLIRVGLPLLHIVPEPLNTTSGHMADPNCIAQRKTNGTVWYEVTRRSGACGNVLRTNTTHAVFSNTLFLYPAKAGSNFSLPSGFPFSCVYPLDSQTSMDLAVRPYLSMQEMGVVALGTGASASMSLYRNSSFLESYPAGVVVLPVGSPLHVGIRVAEVEAERFVVIVEECYITQTANADDLQRYVIIHNRCPSDSHMVLMLENGVSLRVRFTALLFLYPRSYNDMFLHCGLSLCDRTSESCSTKCLTRSVRSINSHKSVTVGPITWMKDGQ